MVLLLRGRVPLLGTGTQCRQAGRALGSPAAAHPPCPSPPWAMSTLDYLRKSAEGGALGAGSGAATLPSPPPLVTSACTLASANRPAVPAPGAGYGLGLLDPHPCQPHAQPTLPWSPPATGRDPRAREGAKPQLLVPHVLRGCCWGFSLGREQPCLRQGSCLCPTAPHGASSAEAPRAAPVPTSPPWQQGASPDTIYNSFGR